MNGETLQLLEHLISCKSISPNDDNCQEIISDRLSDIGFTCERINFSNTKNLWARIGKDNPLFCFACHTDVVPPGDINLWKFDPFIPTIEKGILYGRGSADMKSGLAASITAVERYLKNTKLKGSISFLITSDEEGDASFGTVKVVEVLKKRKELIDYCVITEPTSSSKLGDIIKNGRRGSLNGKLVIKGKQGHIAYPELAINPIHKSFDILNELINYQWDKGNEYFPPTSLQISNINSGNDALNVIPSSVEIAFNLRFSSDITVKQIKSITNNILQKYNIEYSLDWNLSGNSFLTKNSNLIKTAIAAIKKECNLEAKLSTSGGTSDGRFIKDIASQLIEFGPINKSIHQINENIKVEDILKTSKIYENILIDILK